MRYATPVEVVEVLELHNVEGDSVLVTSCQDFEAYQRLPRAIRFEDLQYGLTGWNSDTGRACYKASKKFATPI